MKMNKQTWKQVSISGFTGILMGAGSMKGVQHIEAAEVGNSVEHAPETVSYDDMSFREAFATARAEMGPGGVFRWHGNIYNTYTADEWNSMTAEEKNLFAEQVGAEVSADEVDSNDFARSPNTDGDVRVAYDDNPGVAVTAASEQPIGDDDVRVLGYGEVTLDNGQNVTVQEVEINGQRVAVVDVDQDGEADIAMSDLNHNRQIDEGEVIDLHTGEAVSFTNDTDDNVILTNDPIDI